MSTAKSIISFFFEHNLPKPSAALFFTGFDVIFCWMIQIHKKCQASQSVLPRPWRKTNPWVDFLMVIMASGIAHGRVRTTATKTTELPNMAAILQIIGWQTCNLGLPRTSLILDVHVTINWHLSKQGIRWPVSRDHIAGSSLQFLEATYFLKLTADQVLVIDWIVGSC